METKKRKNVMSMEEEDKAFFDNAMRNPEIRKKIEEDRKRSDDLFRDQSKRLIDAQKKKKANKK